MSTVQAIGALVLRIVGLLAIIFNLANIMFAAAQFQGWLDLGSELESGYLLASMVYWSGMVLLGILLFAFAHPVARLTGPRTEQPAGQVSVTGEEIVSIGSFLMGAALLALHLPGVLLEILKYALALMRDLDTQLSISLLYWRDWWSLAETALMLLIGFWLLLRPTTLAGLYRSLRRAGWANTEPVDEVSRPE
ncbi:MAG: hypothetical protein ACLFV8_07020 [Alphaproteobacteria bacterium]